MKNNVLGFAVYLAGRGGREAAPRARRLPVLLLYRPADLRFPAGYGLEPCPRIRKGVAALPFGQDGCGDKASASPYVRRQGAGSFSAQ